MKKENKRGREYKTYTIAFKMKIIDEIENGFLTKREACKLYQIGESTLYSWLDKYGINERIDKKVIIMTREEESELLLLRRENKLLRRSLEDAQLRSLAYECLVDEASKYTKLDLKKNFGSVVREVVKKRLESETTKEKD